MSAEWRRLTREAGLRVHRHSIEVEFQDRRRQRVHVDEVDGPSLRLWSVVAPQRTVAHLDDPLLHAWRRNRLSELVGFSMDNEGRMIGETWVPIIGLTADEWTYYVTVVAKACDHLEYVLTGSDEG